MKPHSYSQLKVHLIFAVKYREALLKHPINQEIFSYMGGILKQSNHKPLIINGYYDHVHILMGLNPNHSVSDTIWNLKRASSEFINSKNWFIGKFQWQEGYAAFTCHPKQIDRLYKYRFIIIIRTWKGVGHKFSV